MPPWFNSPAVPEAPQATRALRLQALIHHIRSDDPTHHLACTVAIKDHLLADDPPFDEVFQAGLLPCFLEFTSSQIPGLKFEAATVLGLFAVPESHIQAFIDCAALPVFIPLLSSDNQEELLLALQTLGWVAHHRPLVLLDSREALPALFSVSANSSTSEIIQEKVCRIVSP